MFDVEAFWDDQGVVERNALVSDADLSECSLSKEQIVHRNYVDLPVLVQDHLINKITDKEYV